MQENYSVLDGHAHSYGMYRIFRSISRTFDQQICLKFATCDLLCGCKKRGALPSISHMRVAACRACSSLVTRRCSYTAVHMMPSYFSFYCAIFHPCGRSQKAVWRIMPRMCALYKSVCDRPKVRVRLILRKIRYT